MRRAIVMGGSPWMILILIATALGEGVHQRRREDFVALASEIGHPGGWLSFRSNQRTTTSPAWTRASTAARVTAITSLRAERMA